MLTSLYVRNFAVVEEAEIGLGAGLTVVTGETGAGKSLLVDALLLLSGSRADSAMVRAGCDRAELAAEFDLSALPEARRWLENEELDDEHFCQLRRVVKTGGSSRAWINGRPANAGQLAELGALLLEIHGQHEHQALLSRSHQLDLLDAFGHDKEALEQVRDHARRWREIEARMRKLSGGDDRAARIELLRHEHEQLQKWALPAEALAELEAEHRRLANAGRLLEGSNGLAELLDGDSEFAVRRALLRAQSELERLAEIDDRLAPLASLLSQAEIQLSETIDGLGHYASALDLDPERLDEADTHLARLHELARRHRLPVDALHGKLGELEQELAELEGAGEELDALAAERTRCEKDYAEAAKALTGIREKAARKLGEDVSALMQTLGMNGGRFEVELVSAEGEADDTPDPQGRERCEFLVSANPGQPPRALRKVASGGELARISLAIEVAALGLDAVGTMVFDEVDTGIGGAVAEVVGQKLRALGEERQVMCVTHLPQVAAQGHAHLKVLKHTDGETTQTRIEALDDDSRGEELARMLGGVEITRETRAHARRMLEQAQA